MKTDKVKQLLETWEKVKSIKQKKSREQYALEKVRSVCTGQLLFQTHIAEEQSIGDTPWARYYPHGMLSGQNNEDWDPTIFWLFNSACCIAMLDHLGFNDLPHYFRRPSAVRRQRQKSRAGKKRAAGPNPSPVVLM